MPVTVRSCNSHYTVSGEAPVAHKRDSIGNLQDLLLFMSSKDHRGVMPQRIVCIALLEELATFNTNYTMEVNWLERRENTKEVFQVSKVSGGITDTSLSTQFSAGSTCVWDVKQDQYCVTGTESVSE